MATRLMQLQFPATSAEFISRYSLPETILRLRDTSSSSPLTLGRTMACEFNGTQVVLRCSVLYENNRQSPIFTGVLQATHSCVVLTGQFAVRRWVVIHQNIGLIFAVLIAGLFTLSAIAQPRTMWPVPFIAASALALVYGQASLTRWLAHNDVAWLSRRIGQTIGNPDDWTDPPPKPPGWLRRKFLALAGQ